MPLLNPVTGTSCARFRDDGRIAATTHWDGSIRLLECSRRRVYRSLATLRYHKESVYCVDFCGDDSNPHMHWFASGCKAGSVAVWNTYAT